MNQVMGDLSLSLSFYLSIKEFKTKNALTFWKCALKRILVMLGSNTDRCWITFVGKENQFPEEHCFSESKRQSWAREQHGNTGTWAQPWGVMSVLVPFHQDSHSSKCWANVEYHFEERLYEKYSQRKMPDYVINNGRQGKERAGEKGIL